MEQRISRRNFIGGMGAGAVAAGLAACRPTEPPVAPPPVDAPVETPAPELERVHWRHATVIPQFNTVFQHMADRQGFWDEYGIDIELINLQNDANINLALFAEEVDSAEPGSAAGIQGVVSSGGQSRLLGSFQHGLPIALFARSDILTVEDLVGRTLGVSAIGALPHNLALGLLDKYGIDRDLVEFISLREAGATLIRAMAAGTIDAGVSSIEFDQVIADDPEFHRVALFSEEMPDYVRLGWFTTERNLRERPDVLERVILAEALGVRYAMEHREETVELAAELTGGELSTMEFVFDLYVENPAWLDLNFRLSPEQVEFMQDFNMQHGLQDTRMPVEEILIPDFQDAVVRELGEV